MTTLRHADLHELQIGCLLPLYVIHYQAERPKHSRMNAGIFQIDNLGSADKAHDSRNISSTYQEDGDTDQEKAVNGNRDSVLGFHKRFSFRLHLALVPDGLYLMCVPCSSDGSHFWSFVGFLSKN
jgi:hypothetical protein